MFRGIARIFTHRVAGPAWAVTSLCLMLALVASVLQARRTENFLHDRIEALATRDASQLQAELVSCRATVRIYAAAMSASSPQGGAEPDLPTPVRNIRVDASTLAARLAGTPPVGLDVCARMESADQAVLRALDGR